MGPVWKPLRLSVHVFIEMDAFIAALDTVPPDQIVNSESSA
jgi:hypothetical protein